MKKIALLFCLLAGIQMICSGQKNETCSDGLILFRVKGKSGFKNRADKIVIPAIYDSAFSFSEGVTPVKKGGKWFYIDTLGKAIHTDQGGRPVYFKMARPYYHGMAVARYVSNWTGNAVTLIDKSASGYFVDFSADDIGDMDKGYAIIRHGKKFGVINKCLDYLVPAEFDKIDSFSKGYARVLYSGQWRVIDPFGDCISNCSGYPVPASDQARDSHTVYLSNYSLKMTDRSLKKLDELAAEMLSNPAKKYVIEGNGNRSYAAQQNSWECTNKVISYLTETKGIERGRFIFLYGQNGLYRSVSFREAEPGEDGPSNTPPPFAGFRCSEEE